MKLYNFLIFIILLLVSCGGETQTSNQANTSSLPNGYKKMVADLQGSWERTTYPFGGIEFQGEQVKFMEGEGSTTTPTFEKFTISNQCNPTPRAPHLDIPEAYLFRSHKRLCNRMKLVQDTLFLGSLGPNYSIIYTRVK